jgi:DNA polymerase III sliding clamp (beta) subunit (PCNA family)
MLDSLRFVQGAVAKKDFVPALTHFRIEGGTIRGFNGMLGLCCPIDLDLDCSPKALQFVKAVQTCKDTIQLHMTPAGRLSVKSGKFKALVDCIQDSFPEVSPEGQELQLDGGLLKVLKLLAPFIADDASRPWARGILLRGQSAFATNNIVLIERWLGYTFPVEINIPKSAVTELIRIGEEPESLQVTENSVTFHFAGKRWLRTQTYSTQWPDLSRILDRPSTPQPIPDGLLDAAVDLLPFVDELGRLFLAPGQVTTGHGDGAGAAIDVPGIQAEGCFNAQQVILLKGVAKTLDLGGYPGPCAFFGDQIRGALIGMRA